MIKFILSLFGPFRWMIELMGADYNQFISIMKLKLMQDDRRLPSMRKSKKQSQSKTLMKQSLGQIFMGTIFLTVLAIIKNPFTYFYFAHILIMVMMAMMIISEFTTILFDTSENTIIQPLPVKGNTVGLARSAHVFIYLFLMAINLSVGSFIVAIFKFGIVSAIFFFFTLILNVLFTLFLSNILYLGIMKVARGEQLKNLLMYFQIAIAVLFMAGYQFGVNMIDQSVVSDLVISVHWYTFLIPPAFFSGFIESVGTLVFDSQHLFFIVETLIIPVLAVFVTGKYLTPVFNKKLMELEQGDRTAKVKSEKMKNGYWFRLMNLVFVSSSEEKAAFKLMWKMTGRERIFKQTLFPSVGYILFMVLMPFFKGGFDITKLRESDKFLLILYAFFLIALTIPSALLTGNNKHETWMFKSLPLYSPANFFKGFIKAAFARFFIPIYTIVGVGVCSIWGISVLPDVLIALLAIYLFMQLVYYIQDPNFPFSVEKSTAQGGTAFLRILIIILMAGVSGALHWVLLRHWFNHANLLLIPLYVGAIFYVDKFFVYKKITWIDVNEVNAY